MKRKVLLFGYSRANFGDDLFVYILGKKYQDVDFYIHIKEKKYKKPFNNSENIHCIEDERDLRKIEIDEYDAFCYVGGSIFIESEYAWHEAKEFQWFIKKCKENLKPFFYITCNFGPYQTQEYLEKIRENFKLATGVCVRDKNSYERFKDIETVKYAPDMVLSYKINLPKKDKKTVGISIINLEIRDKLKDKKEMYEDYIKRIIIKFAKRNYKVSLISFCEFEEDKIAIEKIKKLVPEEYKNNVQELMYNGNIEEFIESYGKIKYMICTRFHSLILSILAKQKIYNLCYSKKQSNFINDYKLFKKSVMISNINYDIRLRMYNFRKVSFLKNKKLVNEAEGQFKAFEEWLNG